MRSMWLIRAARSVTAFLVVAAVVGASSAAAKPAPERPARRSRAMNLFALTNAVIDVNRVYCGINNLGELCVDPTNSPVIGGGYWPKGTPDQYIFNSGLQIAGIVSPTAGFAWAGDTTGAYFFDARGTQVQGDAITLVYNSLDPSDQDAWPNGAVVRDALLYHPRLLGRDNISQQDLWTRAWDGNPNLLSGRTHPMGILVEERGLAWNFPTGNEDIIYFVFTFYNVTARNPAAYANPTIPPEVQAEIAAVGAQFQDRNEAAFNINIPDDGYTLEEVYASFSMDPDVGDAAHNYATAVLPFNMGMAYKADFLEPGFNYPGDIFGTPFTAAPGFVGVKYLRSPTDALGNQVGLTMFSNTRNAADAFPDPVGVRQLWRYLSGNVNPAGGDNPCTFPNPRQRGLCFLDQSDVDTRFYQASGPLTVPPGEARSIVVAYVHAAPLALVEPYIGAASVNQLKPQFPFPGDSIYFDGGKVRTIERAAGWVSHSDLDGNERITQDEVVTTPRSLLDKALVAQAVFDNHFLLPFAPVGPKFFLVPGDNQVTVTWQPSPTEEDGDPYFEVASPPLNEDGSPNVLYDPNFRQFDVEGYRIYRGRTTGALALIAQFDYQGTELIDYTGSFAYTGKCAPELGVQDECPDAFPSVTGVSHPLVGEVIQMPAGGRVELADGSILIISSDTAVTGGAAAKQAGYQPLEDTGVGFAFTDRSVRNSFTYYYAVTAFDVNSVSSGPTSLESARSTKAVTPRAGSGQTAVGEISALELLGADGSVLTGSLPTIAPATAIFSGPMPPTDGIELGLVAFLPELLTNGAVTVTVDSVVPGSSLTGVTPALYYLTAQGSGAPASLVVPITLDAFSEEVETSASFPATNIDQGKSVVYGGDSSYALFGSATIRASGTWRLTGWGRGSINGDPPNSDQNGPRWWEGTGNENTPGPNTSRCPGSPGACVQVDLSRTAGALPGVTVLFHPLAYGTVNSVPQRDFEAITSTVTRAADFRVYWGAAGAIDSVIDRTHKVPVPFSTKVRASWGILNEASFATTNAATTQDQKNTLLTWSDIYCVDPTPRYINRCGGAAQTPAVLQSTAALSPIAAQASSYVNTTALTQTGTGFIFYLNGHFFLMQMAALPAAGTVWNARFYSGVVTGTEAAGDYAFTSAIRPPAVPGLRARVSYTGSQFDPAITSDAQLARVHTVPDPYYVTNSLEISQNTRQLKFVNLPAQSIIRIYSQSGVLVQVLTHNDPTGGGEENWNLRNRNNQFVASGVYFYHVETPDGKSRIARFTVVNFAQ